MSSAHEVLAAATIRAMKAEDLDQVMAIETGSFGSPWSRTHFMDELNNPDLSIPLVVDNDGIITGYLVVWIILDECHVANIAVHPEWRRCGVGRRLMERAVEAGRERGSTRIMLEVRASNTAAIRLYESYGFVRVGIRKNYYHDGFLKTEDGILMDLDLTGGKTT